jgi:lysophospholipid acyltransferase (LPLAT)-like uncharacterized protein
MTWRVRVENLDKVAEARKVKGQILYCFWHSNLFVLCYTHRSSNAGLMISQSFDGEIVSRILQRLGYKIFRGSTSRGGAVALLKMLKDQSCDLALTVDGPRGPAEKVKSGAVMLAAHSGSPILPISVVASRAWRMKSWDRLIIPKPFSIVTIKHGDLIMVERRPENIDQIAETIENGIKGLS